MRLLTRALQNATTRSLQDRLVWQCASLLLAYPDEHFAERLGIVDELRAPVAGRAAEMLARTVEALRARDPMQAAADYVETFDLRRRSTLYLTYWTSGDTRNRGREMLAFARVYRDAGVRPPDPGHPSTRLPITFRSCSSSRRPSTPLRGGGCWSSTGCRSTCCAMR